MIAYDNNLMLGQSIELLTETLSNVFLDLFQFPMVVIQTRQYCNTIIKNKCVSMQDYIIMLTCTIAGHIKNSNFQGPRKVSQKNAYFSPLFAASQKKLAYCGIISIQQNDVCSAWSPKQTGYVQAQSRTTCMMLVSELTEAYLNVSFWQQTSVTTWQLCTIHSARAAVFLLCKTVLVRMQYSQ